MSESAALEFVELHKEFKLGLRLKRVHAVRGVTLRVEPGEIFGYLGPNGAGKTTTMKMAMGLIRPTSGEIRLFGRPVTDRAVQSRVGFLPEQPYFYDYLTPVELLRFYGKLFGLDRKLLARRTEELLELVGLEEARNRRLRGFSKGMLQRAGIAQALVNEPDLVVLDEPLSGLDPIGRKEVRDIVAGLRQRGCTVFFSSHILHDIEMICDRVAIIDKGVVEQVGPLDELLTGGDSRVDVVVRGADDALRDRLRTLAVSLDTAGHTDVVTVEEARSAELLRAILDAGAQVAQVEPHRASLEEVFIRQAGGEGA